MLHQVSGRSPETKQRTGNKKYVVGLKTVEGMNQTKLAMLLVGIRHQWLEWCRMSARSASGGVSGSGTLLLCPQRSSR